MEIGSGKREGEVNRAHNTTREKTAGGGLALLRVPGSA